MAPTPGGKLPAGKRAAEPAEEGKAQPAKKAKAPAESKGVHAPLAPTAKAVPPSDVREYRDRLVKQKKELYKDPPMLPDLDSEVLPGTKPLPTRNADGELAFADCAKFRPNLSPKEIMQAGSFGGTYFRPIVSAVTGETYRGVHKQRRIVSPTYDASVNQWKVSCGGSLGMWESSGWISFIDPYGWFQWYCRYYLGRRSTDDERQIDRWLKGQGPTGRWRTQLCNKVLQTSAKKFDDPKVSPVIRQTCLHWGYALTERDLKKHATKKGIAL
jgi:hypothetical protein